MNKQIATLIAITETPVKSKFKKVEKTYEYAVNETTLKFHAHPTRAWNWVVIECTMDSKTANKVISAICAARFDSELIQKLELV